METVNALSEIRGCKRLKGWEDFYRIRIGEYRLGIKDLSEGNVAVLRFLHRREIYRRFP
jgi:mRNA interferase RelE/StbE